MEKAREDLSRLEITWGTVALVLAELPAAEAAGRDVLAGKVPEADKASVPRGSGVTMVPPWREGLVVAMLPDVYRHCDLIAARGADLVTIDAKDRMPSTATSRYALSTATVTVRIPADFVGLHSLSELWRVHGWGRSRAGGGVALHRAPAEGAPHARRTRLVLLGCQRVLARSSP